jgi:hypothetical protein
MARLKRCPTLCAASEDRGGASSCAAGCQQPVVKVRRRTEGGDAPGWQGATIENIGNI